MERGVSRRRAALETLTGSTANIIVVVCQAVILIPLYLRFVGPSLYGAWLAAADLLIWLQAMDLGIPNLLIQRIGLAHGKGERAEVGEYLATGLFMTFVTAIALFVAAFIAVAYVPSLFRIEGADATTLVACLRVAALAAAMMVLANGAIGFSRAVQDTLFLNVVVVAAGILALIVSACMLLAGLGLWALPLGMLCRSAIIVGGGAAFVSRHVRVSLRGFFRLSWGRFRELARVSPATALGGIAYAVMNQSENVIAGIVLGPAVVPVLAVTRKAADVGRAILDAIGYAAYGGFAQLMGSDDRHRANAIYREVMSLRLSLAVAAAGAFVMVNRNLVELWVGSEFFGGLALTVVLGLQLIVVGEAYLANSLLRAAGAVVEGSVGLVVEAMVRVPLMFILASAFGLIGLAACALLTSLGAIAWSHRRILPRLSPIGTPGKLPSLPLNVARVAILFMATGATFLVSFDSVLGVVLTGAAVAGGGALWLLWLDPALATMRRMAVGQLAAFRQHIATSEP